MLFVRSEAYALGIKLGADPALLATVINSSSGQVLPQITSTRAQRNASP